MSKVFARRLSFATDDKREFPHLLHVNCRGVKWRTHRRKAFAKRRPSWRVS